LSLLILGALAYLTHQFVDVTLERDSLGAKLANVTRFNEIRSYKETVEMAPEEARRILEILDKAIVMSDSEDEVGLIGVPEPTQEENPTDPNAPADTEAGPVASNEGAPTDTPEAPPADATASESPEAQASSVDPLQEAWRVWHEASGTIANPAVLDIDAFEVSPSGNVTFLLKQNDKPGLRVKGRVLVVLALSDAEGKISLVSAPTIDLTKPEQAWELGSKYNIVASKIVRVQASIPTDSKIINAEVASWDEETKRLVFRKKILIEDQ
jgi:hypothetical protein